MSILEYIRYKIAYMSKPYYLLVYYLGILAGLMVGLQIGGLSRLFEREEDNFKNKVKQSIAQSKNIYATWISHTSSSNDPNSYNNIYYNKDSSFVVLIAQSAQQYPLLDFKPDSILPKRRLKQFQEFSKLLEESRRKENKRLKEFYVLRSIQYCADCEKNKESVAKVFPLDSLIKSQLAANEIQTEVLLAFYNPAKKIYTSFPTADVSEEEMEQSEYRYDFIENEQVVLYFPQKNQYLLYNLAVPMSTSLGLVIITLFIYTISVRIILKQKKLAQLKNDFINNVSHEFKTPIATIAFAVANIENEKTLQNPEMIRQFSKVIKDENKRLNGQVEKVLQAAIEEQKALELKKENVNMHALINELADSYEFKIKDKGFLHRKLNAGKAEIIGDIFHLGNAISNLLDNAIKYSGENIEIQISTDNDAHGFFLHVSDKGMGISKENQKLIFDKFYRVPQGNLHNTKGFGLGLSYVKEIVTRHKGFIKVQSKQGQGSTFTVFLPFETEKNHEQS